MENELAVLAIKGGRYSEAEEMYNKEISSNPFPMSYFGLGLCKINMILDSGRTTDEAFYCFNKYLSLSNPEDRKVIENDIIAVSLSTLEQLQNLKKELEKEKKKKANQVILGAALTVGSAMIGSNRNSNAFTQLSSLAVAGSGVGLSMSGLSDMGSIPEIENKVNKILFDIKNYLKDLILIQKEFLNETLNQIEEKEINENLAVLTEKKAKNKWLTTLLLSIFLGWAGAHRFYTGKSKTGILMLVLYIIGIVLVGSGGGQKPPSGMVMLPYMAISIWYLVDLITIIIGKFKDGEGNYITRKKSIE